MARMKYKNIPVKDNTFNEYLECFDGKKTHDEMVRCLVRVYKRQQKGVRRRKQ